MKHKTFLISIVFSIVLVVSCAPATDVEYDQVISTQSHVKGNEQITSTPMQCGNNHMFYPFDEKISTTSIRDFYFSNDNEVYFSVWNYKEYSTDLAHLDSYQVQSDINVLPKDNTQTFKLGLDRIGLNLTTGYFAQPAISPIYDICESGDCPIVDVLSSSPNKKWQLAQITEGIAHGVWLLGENSATHLLPFLPGSSEWQWANNGSKLLYQFSAYDNANVLFADLIDFPPDIDSTITTNSLNPNLHRLILDEDKELIYSVSLPSPGNEVNQFTFNQEYIGLLLKGMPTLSKMYWDQANEEVIFVLDRQTHYEFTDLSGELIGQINEVAMENVVLDTLPRTALPFVQYAWAPKKDKVALLHHTGILILDCLASSNT